MAVMMDYHYQRFILPTSSDNCPIFTNDWRQTGGDLNNTTRFSFFAKCLRHSANADIHSAKPFLSVTLGKGRSVNSLSAKTSLSRANPTLVKEKWP